MSCSAKLSNKRRDLGRSKGLSECSNLIAHFRVLSFLLTRTLSTHFCAAKVRKRNRAVTFAKRKFGRSGRSGACLPFGQASAAPASLELPAVDFSLNPPAGGYDGAGSTFRLRSRNPPKGGNRNFVLHFRTLLRSKSERK